MSGTANGMGVMVKRQSCNHSSRGYFRWDGTEGYLHRTLNEGRRKPRKYLSRMFQRQGLRPKPAQQVLVSECYCSGRSSLSDGAGKERAQGRGQEMKSTGKPRSRSCRELAAVVRDFKFYSILM